MKLYLFMALFIVAGIFGGATYLEAGVKGESKVESDETSEILVDLEYKCNAKCLLLSDSVFPGIAEPRVTDIYRLKGASYELLADKCRTTGSSGRSLLVHEFRTYSEIIGYVRPDHRYLKSYKKANPKNTCFKAG